MKKISLGLMLLVFMGPLGCPGASDITQNGDQVVMENGPTTTAATLQAGEPLSGMKLLAKVLQVDESELVNKANEAGFPYQNIDETALNDPTFYTQFFNFLINLPPASPQLYVATWPLNFSHLTQTFTTLPNDTGGKEGFNVRLKICSDLATFWRSYVNMIAGIFNFQINFVDFNDPNLPPGMTNELSTLLNNILGYFSAPTPIDQNFVEAELKNIFSAMLFFVNQKVHTLKFMGSSFDPPLQVQVTHP